ncbi:MAG: hypothetical protein K0S44_196 [Bacteroidetes bacterium]|jgi:hypothetical protein|nr:hypothetical protein [Bacteroidota bacterium]
MRILSIVACIILFNSCETQKNDLTEKSWHHKTAREIEDSSLATGKTYDSISFFKFGNSVDQVYGFIKQHNYTLLSDSSLAVRNETDHFNLIDGIRFHFYKNKLWRTEEYPLLGEIIQKDTMRDFNKDIFSNLVHTFGSPRENSIHGVKYYWVSGNKRFEYLIKTSQTGEEFSVLVCTDMRIERERDKEIQDLQSDLEANELAMEYEIVKQIKAVASSKWPDDYITQEYWIKEQLSAYNFMKNIPNDNNIKRKAVKDWPFDFVTQKFWYEEQTAARNRLK